MQCPECGKQLANRYRFCTRCGASQRLDTEFILSESYNRPVRAPEGENNRASRQTAPVSGKYVSDHDNMIQFSPQMIKKVLKALGTALIVILIIWQFSDPYRNVVGIKDMREAYTHATEVVAGYFTKPASELDFPKFDLDFIQRNGSITFENIEFNVYIISAYVDTPNAFGAITRHEYTMRIGIPLDKDIEQFYYEEPEFGDWYTPKS